MSEFILLGGTPIAYHGIYATQSYLYTRNDGTDFSTAPSSQFGNGFASFRIDGTCDTVWAGHRFQKNVRTTTVAPNKLILSPGGSISGGQGILIWSLNYDVENAGVITGATANKFGLANTADIALLFKGDTSNTWGTPITTGVNRLTNAGTIASPGTAVLAEAGDTIVTNNAGGLISGGRCAIQTGPGAATIVVNGGRIEGGAYAIRTGAGNDTVTIFGGGLVGRVDLGTGTDGFNVAVGGVRLGVALRRDTADTARILVKDGGAGTVTLADNTVVAVQAGGGAAIGNNDRFLLVDTDNLTVNPANLVIENATTLPMVRFSAEKSGGQLLLVAARDGAYYGRGSGNASLGAVLDALANNATGDMAAVLGDLDRSGSPANARQLQPPVDRGIIQASLGQIGQMNQTVLNRMDQVMAGRIGGDGKTGIAAGDGPPRWVSGSRGPAGSSTRRPGKAPPATGLPCGGPSVVSTNRSPKGS
jgi:hypothetical protein